ISPDWINLTCADLSLKYYGFINASNTHQKVAVIAENQVFAAYKKAMDPKNQNPTDYHYPTLP
ncbi:hypothetical protein, partial [Salmonella enterica]|uniref:hypothetical protein n=1 Tax=Salmonella enterica TaxID=28901 RepID=UPI0021B36AB4